MEGLERITDGEEAEATMPSIRDELAKLNQCIHEFNAYRNALLTD